MDKRRSNEPLLVGLNIRIAEGELALLDGWLKGKSGLTRSSGARKLLAKALAQALREDADAERER